MKTLASILRSARESKGYKLHHVAKYCDISIAYLGALETGKALRPKIRILQKAAEILQIDPDVLIITAEKIPPDVYWKIVYNPKLIDVIRNLEA